MANPRPALTTTPEISRRMSRQPSWDTSIELSLRSELHRRGFRYRVHRRPLAGLRREADLLFSGAKVAVFVDGCFWHGCPEHCAWPRTNVEYWHPKLQANIDRDRNTDELLAEAGWISVRIWEHEPTTEAADRVASAVAARREPVAARGQATSSPLGRGRGEVPGSGGAST